MNQDIIVQLGSLVGKAIPLAMGLVAVSVGWVMIFDAIRIYRARETKTSSQARSKESAADAVVTPSSGSTVAENLYLGPGNPRRARQNPYAYRQTRKTDA